MAGGGEDWNETREAKSQNLDPGIFWQAAECEIYRISYVGGAAASVPAPQHCKTGAVREDKRAGLREWDNLDMMFCQNFFFFFHLQNTTMQIRWQYW